MSADDNLREALIEAYEAIQTAYDNDGDVVRLTFKGGKIVKDSAPVPVQGGKLNAAACADIALMVMKNTTAEAPKPIDAIGSAAWTVEERAAGFRITSQGAETGRPYRDRSET